MVRWWEMTRTSPFRLMYLWIFIFAQTDFRQRVLHPQLHKQSTINNQQTKHIYLTSHAYHSRIISGCLYTVSVTTPPRKKRMCRCLQHPPTGASTLRFDSGFASGLTMARTEPRYSHTIRFAPSTLTCSRKDTSCDSRMQRRRSRCIGVTCRTCMHRNTPGTCLTA